MPILFTYLLKLSVALSIVYFFYIVALRRLTFYNWNRWYLLLYTALCFLFPLINISSLIDAEEASSNHIIYLVPTLSDFNKQVIVSENATGVYTVWKIIAIVFLTGMVFLLGRLLIQLQSYRSMLRNASLLSNEGIRVYETKLSAIPFSFGRSVFINPGQHTEEELAEIIKHEFVHVKQAHTVDVLWGELLCIVNWFNPFAWMLRNAIRQNLEFIADDKVLQEGIDKKQYQYLLLKVTGNKLYSIVQPFNFSSLKKRIAMMNKSKTAKLQLMRFLFLLPVVVVMLLVFRKDGGAQVNASKNVGSESGSITDTVVPVKEVTLVPLPPSLINLRKDVKDISIKGDVVTVFLQNGKKEQYDFTDKKQKEALEKKYGKLPSGPVVSDTVSSIRVQEVILEPRSKVATPSAPTKISSTIKPSETDTVSPVQTTWKKWTSPGLSKNLKRVPVHNTWQQWNDIPSQNEKSLSKSSISISGEAKISMQGNDKPVSYYTPGNKPESLRMDKAIVTAESISMNSKTHSLKLKGEASFKNAQGVQAYATTIELSLKELFSLPYVLLNNKELQWDTDYSSTQKQSYEVSFLKKEEAIRKYGDKGKEGALEITSL